MSVTLLYTTYDRTPLLRTALERLRERTLPDEIVVVDDGGSDGCDALCVEAAHWFAPRTIVKYVYNHRPLEAMCSQARNVGVRASTSDAIVTSEPEMLFDTDVIAELSAAHAEDQQWGTQRVLNVGTIHHEQRAGLICPCGCGQPKHTTVNWQAFWICLFRRQWLLDVGGWDENFPSAWGWDDVDLGSRLRIWGVGQHNLMSSEATHQWHTSRVCDQGPNEHYFKSKGFHGDERRDHPHVMANAGHAWGTVIPRP